MQAVGMKRRRKGKLVFWKLMSFMELRPWAGLVRSSAHRWDVEIKDEEKPGNMAYYGQSGP